MQPGFGMLFDTRLVLKKLLALLAFTIFRPLWRRDTLGVTIVHYHWVDEQNEANFERHLCYYAQNYTILSLSQAVHLLQNSNSVTESYLVVTTDDGFACNYERIAPMLRKYAIPACFFIPTGFISDTVRDGAALLRCAGVMFRLKSPRRNMTWEQLRELANDGFEIGSHSVSHCNLAAVPVEQAQWEIWSSRQSIETRVGAPVRYFAFPYGGRQHFTPELRQEVEISGYEACLSGVRGINRGAKDVFSLHRHDIKDHWPLMLVRFFLEGAYAQLLRPILPKRICEK